MEEKGYEGAPADLWSCGIILYVFLAGYLPFKDSNLGALRQKMNEADLEFPLKFPSEPQKLIRRLLDPNPKTRITVTEIFEDEWFRSGDLPVWNCEEQDSGLSDSDAFFDSSEDDMVNDSRPDLMNAFEIISLFSQGLDLSGLFTEKENACKCETKFTSMHPAKDIIAKIENFASSLGYGVKKRNYKMKIESSRPGRKGYLSVLTEVLQVAPSLFMVDMKKKCGDTLEFRDFQNQMSIGLKDIVWKSQEDMSGV